MVQCSGVVNLCPRTKVNYGKVSAGHTKLEITRLLIINDLRGTFKRVIVHKTHKKVLCETIFLRLKLFHTKKKTHNY